MPAQTVRITLKCNHGCVFCFADWSPEVARRRRDVHDYTNVIGADWRRELDDVRASGYDELSISGGEPLLHPELLPMVHHAKQLGFRRIEVQSNASLMTESNVSLLTRAGMTSCMASLPSHREKNFNAITRTQGHFVASVNGIRNLLAARVEVILCHVICAGNYRLLADFVRFVHEELGTINEILFFYVQPEGRAAQNLKVLPRLAKLRAHWAAAMAEADRLLDASRWADATASYRRALAVPGYEDDADAKAGIQAAQDAAATEAAEKKRDSSKRSQAVRDILNRLGKRRNR